MDSCERQRKYIDKIKSDPEAYKAYLNSKKVGNKKYRLKKRTEYLNNNPEARIKHQCKERMKIIKSDPEAYKKYKELIKEADKLSRLSNQIKISQIIINDIDIN